MADPKPADSTREGNRPEETPPKLVAVSETPVDPKPSTPTPGATEPTSKGISRTLFGLVVVLLLLALGGLYAQTQRATAQAEQITLLNNQVEGLEVQLSAANTQLATYDMRLTLVQSSVRDMYEKMGSLLELVSISPGLVEPETPAPR
jgi:uncharacterized protein HemX